MYVIMHYQDHGETVEILGNKGYSTEELAMAKVNRMNLGPIRAGLEGKCLKHYRWQRDPGGKPHYACGVIGADIFAIERIVLVE